MKNPDPDKQIQPPPTPSSPALPLSEAFDETMPLPKPSALTSRAGLFFGAAVGLLMGAVVGAACSALVGLIDFLWHGAVIGALIGPIGGALIGSKKSRSKRYVLSPDIATIICAVYGLLPGVLILLGGLGFVKGKFSGFLLLGSFSAGPMIGLLIGAVLDRAYEASLNRAWGVALGWGVAGVAGCIGISMIIARLASPPDPEDVASEAKTVILREWYKKPELRDATIQNVTLVRQGGKVYSGFVDARIGGQPEKLHLEVIYYAEGTLELKLKPMNE